MQPQMHNYQCVVCQEVITNPICADCMGKEVKTWNVDLELGLPLPSAGDFTTLKSPWCVICGKEVHVCPYCSTAEIFDYLEEFHPELIDAYLLLFSYDKEHTGYEKVKEHESMH